MNAAEYFRLIAPIALRTMIMLLSTINRIQNLRSENLESANCSFINYKV